MKKIGMNVYSINELEKDVKAKVLDRHRYDFNDIVNFDIQDEFKQRLEEKGYPIDDIRYSLNHCQGDGMAFYGTIDLEEFIEKRHEELEKSLSKHDLRRVKYIAKEGLTIDIRKNQYFHLYNHYNTMIIEVNGYVDEYMSYRAKDSDIEEMTNSVYELEEFIKYDVKDISGELESIGYDIAESYENDEYIIEYLEENEYYFTKDGIEIDTDMCEEIM